MNKKKGISLIVLVITIVVMIVLAAAVIISLNNNEIIEKTKNVVNKYNQEELEHLAQVSWAEAYLNGARTEIELKAGVQAGLRNAGLNPDEYGIIVTKSGVHKIAKGWLQDGVIITKGNATLEAGDLIQYDSGVSEYTGKWRVLGAEDDKLLILSTANVGSLGLCGLEGGTYNDTTYEYGLLNGIDRLNEICEAYGSGTGAVGARSIKAEDVCRLSDIQPIPEKYTVGWNKSTSRVEYTTEDGVTRTLGYSHSTTGFNYVDYTTMTKKTIPYNGEGTATLTINGYETIGINNILSQNAKNMLIGDTRSNYWLATLEIERTGDFGFNLCYFRRDIAIYSLALFTSLNNISGTSMGVRCVVELASNVIIGEKDDTLGLSYTI